MKALGLAVLLALAGSPVWAADWPQLQHDPQHTGHTADPGPTGGMQTVVLAVTDLVPETARFLRDMLSPEIQKTVDRVAEAAPDWFVTYAPARMGGEVLTHVPRVAVGVALGPSVRFLED